MKRKVIDVSMSVGEGRVELDKGYTFFKENQGNPMSVEEIAVQLFSGDINKAQSVVDYLSSLDREYETGASYQGIRKIFTQDGPKYEYFDYTMINGDYYRDYDYRSELGGIDFCPKNMFYFTLAQVMMANQRTQEDNVPNNKVLMIAKDARKQEPEVIEAQIKAALVLGWDVKFVSAKTSSCVSYYSWAVRVAEPTQAMFDTASHVSRPKGVRVFGVKSSILGNSGELESLSTSDIKQWSRIVMTQLIENRENIRNTFEIGGKQGKYSELDVFDSFVDMSKVAGLAASGLIDGKDLYDIDMEMKNSSDIVATVKQYASEYKNLKPLKGLKVTVDGAHTQSGPLAQESYRSLGADVTLINGDLIDVDGPHKADPNKFENLNELIERMKKDGSHIGIAFDLDGDRGAVVIRTKEGKFIVLAPDQLNQIMMPFLNNEGGYSKAGDLAYIGDCLSTNALLAQAKQLGWEYITTDAGYVFLKAANKKIMAEGKIAPSFGEASGHGWTSFTGAFENPITQTILFTSMVMKEISEAGNAEILENPSAIHEVVSPKTIPFSSVPRYQPLFTEDFMKYVESLQKEELTNSQMVFQARSESIRIFKDELFPVGKTFETPLGQLKVEKFETSYDEEAKGYRFAKIHFSLNGEWIGTFVHRASSNDPTAVQRFEVKGYTGDDYDFAKPNIQKPEIIENWLSLVGGTVLTTANEHNVLSLETGGASGNMEVVMPYIDKYKQIISGNN